MAPLTYAAVVATRNRPQALELSLPLLLGQSRPPAQVIIVDSSDDGTRNQEIVARNARASGLDISYLRSRPGSALQRNVGLRQVDQPVVFFPDDDSLLLPDAMSEIMSAYERDTEHVVGGVCAADADRPPAGVLAGAAYRMSRPDRVRHALAHLRRRLERIAVPDPFLCLAEYRYRTLPRPEWVDGRDFVLVEFMTGYRMSFRTEVARAEPFDETLGRYALYEDSDASLRVLRSRVLVGARRARIFHHKNPDSRDRGYAMGAMQVLNRAYVMAKHEFRTRDLMFRVRAFERYKLLQYSLDRSEYGRDRLRGARAATRFTTALFRSRPEEVADVYLRARMALGLDAQTHAVGDPDRPECTLAGALNA